jgi:hypothetical protein
MNDTTMLLPHIKLRFNIEHPSLEECYVYGYECAAADVIEENNPYRIGSKEYEHWAEGWWAGIYGEEPAFVLEQASDSMSGNEASSANDHVYHENMDNFFIKLLEISGMIAVSALVGYQLIELVA